MAFVPYKGKFTNRFYPKKASTALGENALVDVINGFIEVCDILRKSHSGVNVRPVVSTDSDYAAATRIPLILPTTEDCSWIADMDTGVTAVTTDVGNYLDIAGTPVGSAITNATSADDAVLVDAFISASKLAVIINATKAKKEGLGTDV